MQLLSVIPLTLIAWQDFRYRAISWMLLPVIFISGFLTSLPDMDYTGHLSYVAVNVFFLFIQFSCIVLYFSLRHGRFINVIDSYLGAGDIFFLLAIAPFFSPVYFILFYVGSISLTLVAACITRIVWPRGNPRLPLAGYLSIFLMLTLGTMYFLNHRTA